MYSPPSKSEGLEGRTPAVRGAEEKQAPEAPFPVHVTPAKLNCYSSSLPDSKEEAGKLVTQRVIHFSEHSWSTCCVSPVPAEGGATVNEVPGLGAPEGVYVLQGLGRPDTQRRLETQGSPE